MMKLLLTLEEASQATGISVEALRAAITQDYTGAKTKMFKRLPRLAAKAPRTAGSTRSSPLICRRGSNSSPTPNKNMSPASVHEAGEPRKQHFSFEGYQIMKLETFQAWAIKALTAAILIEASVATALLIDWWWQA